MSDIQNMLVFMFSITILLGSFHTCSLMDNPCVVLHDKLNHIFNPNDFDMIVKLFFHLGNKGSDMRFNKGFIMHKNYLSKTCEIINDG